MDTVLTIIILFSNLYYEFVKLYFLTTHYSVQDSTFLTLNREPWNFEPLSLYFFRNPS